MTTDRIDVVHVDPDPAVRERVRSALGGGEPWTVTGVAEPAAAAERVSERRPDCLVGTVGPDLSATVRATRADLPIVRFVAAEPTASDDRLLTDEWVEHVRRRPDRGTVDLELLDARVERLVERCHERTARADEAARLRRYADCLAVVRRTVDRLVRAEEPAAVPPLVVEGLETTFEFDLVGVWTLSASGDRLEPAGITDRGRELIDEVPTYRRDEESLTWAAFEAGETRTVGNVRDRPSRHNPETPIGSEIVAPIGEYAVLNVGSTAPEAFTEHDVRLVELWADTARTAFALTEQVDRLERRTEQLRRERDRLSELVTGVAHNLRNPLNVALGRLDDLPDDGSSAALERALHRMEQLVEDALRFARHGREAERTEPVSLDEVVRDRWAAVGADVEGATLCRALDGPPVVADPERLADAVANLLDNAVRHAGPSVSVVVGRLDDGFYVADDGPGIPAEERERVFDGGYSTATQGTGLGLAIVREVAQAHGWSVRAVESAPGGARIEVVDVTFDDGA